jgi:hypothetical protein
MQVISLLVSILKLVPYIKDIILYFEKQSAINAANKAADEIAKKRKELDKDPDGRPPPSLFCLFFLFSFLTLTGFQCTSLPPNWPVTERRIHWPVAVVCEKWTGDVEPTLVANDPTKDMKLQDGRGQSCFTQTDIGWMAGEVEKYKIQLENCLKHCQ